MIRMTRVRLINWHNFVDETIDFKTITYLIGVNAVGKTTILDAIRYCLTTNKDFNSAGNKKSSRTLQGSVHQKQRADNEYLRPGHTVAYIGIEFLDEEIQKRFTITARVESENPYQDLKSVYQDWYVSKPGYTLDDLPFFIQDNQGRHPSKREEFNLDNHGMDRASSQADARRRICRQLGIGDAESGTGKKFNDVFHMGTSLENITDIRKFIYTYILPETTMNTDMLYQDMRELENLQEILLASQKRAEALEEINSQLDEAAVRDARVKSFELLLFYARWQAKLSESKSLTESSRRLELDISVLDGEIETLQKKYDFAFEQLTTARARLKEDENYQKMDSLRAELQGRKNEYDVLRKRAAAYDTAVDAFQTLYRELRSREIVADGTLIFPSPDETDYTARIASLQTEMNEIGNDLIDRQGKLTTEISHLADEIKALTSEIKELERGKMSYPEAAKYVCSAINSAFAEHGIKDRAKLLCELLEMSHPEWQDAVESYLNTQRLYIIVPPAQYQLAKQVFVSLGDAVEKIALVNTVALMKQSRPQHSEQFTLSKTVVTENQYVQAYIDYRMGDVVCCESTEDLEKYPKSVTTDRLCYQGYVLRRMRKQISYIGQNAIKMRLDAATAELREKHNSQNKLEAQRKTLAALNSDCQRFISGNAFTILASDYHARENAESLYTEITELDSRITQLEQNPILQSMVDRVEECDKIVHKVTAEMYDKGNQRQSKIDSLQDNKDKIQKLDSVIAAAEAEYQQYQAENGQYVSDMEKEYAELIRKQTPQDIIENNKNHGLLQRRINDLDNFINNHLLPLQRQYCAEYSMDYPEGLEGIKQYQNAYSSLTKIDLERNQSNLQKAQKLCKERFRKEVLFRMKDDIERAKRLFRELNRVMGSLKYGEESYEFYISGSKDKELQIFYDLIMDKDNRQMSDQMNLFTAPVSDAFETHVEEFMQRIMIEIEQRSQQSVSGQRLTGKEAISFADYREYLDYDILVKNAVTGKEVRLSKVSGDGSGGENQAPFYVAICASLLQIYQQSENCIQLVLLDEAFNNMTSDRIRPMMEMFRNLNLQLILIATPEKCTSIHPFCDITYSIIKQGSRTTVAPFEAAEL